jgi:hypothetical protein
MEALTMMGDVQFGRMWEKMTLALLAPTERAASMYDSSFSDNVFP